MGRGLGPHPKHFPTEIVVTDSLLNSEIGEVRKGGRGGRGVTGQMEGSGGGCDGSGIATVA